MGFMASDSISPTVSEARVRRVPKYGVFLMLGAAVGILAAAILTFAFGGSAEKSEIGVTYSSGQVFGFLMLFCVTAGVALGAIVALILDRVVGRRTHLVTIERERIVAADD